MKKPGRGFTLIELLVVIAIIAILAAMLFPVFACARESARKIQCMSNVKNIALAFQMYLTDYDAFPPSEHNAEAIANVRATQGMGSSDSPCSFQEYINPYLRWPVILDEYVRNRDVWTCPDAIWLQSHFVAFDPGGSLGWLWWEVNHSGHWGGPGHFQYACEAYYPSGWGGTVTDSAMQYQLSNAGLDNESAKTSAFNPTQGAFQGTIGTTEKQNYGLKLAAIEDPSNFVVAADALESTEIERPIIYGVTYLACHWKGGCASDWVNCPWSQTCGLDVAHQKLFWTDATFRKSRARHFGGSNIGFADGHAAWWNCDALLAAIPHWDCPDGTSVVPGTIMGFGESDMVTRPDCYDSR